jgi:hypothetical protein
VSPHTPGVEDAALLRSSRRSALTGLRSPSEAAKGRSQAKRLIVYRLVPIVTARPKVHLYFIFVFG